MPNLSLHESAHIAWKLLEAQRLIVQARDLLCDVQVNRLPDGPLCDRVKALWRTLYADQVTGQGGDGLFIGQLEEIAVEVMRR